MQQQQFVWPELPPVEELSTSSWPSDDLLPPALWSPESGHTNNNSQWYMFLMCKVVSAFCFPPTSFYYNMRVCVHLSEYLCLRNELRDLLAGVERCHLHMGHTPVSPTRGVQNLVMFLQDLTETSEVQVLLMTTRKQQSHIYSRQTDWKASLRNIKFNRRNYYSKDHVLT